ncbi:MAG: hypothetical protein QOD07_2157 [Frankiaceae bacterium]|jgi:hypothetical protein|nr:hypothetical protein [Frankiaceae bacterium]
MAHEVIHVVHRSVEAGGALLAIGGAALGCYLSTPTCTAGTGGLFPKPPVCSNRIGTVHVTGSAVGDASNGFSSRPDTHQVGWAFGGIVVGAIAGGAVGLMWRELRGAAG